VIDNAPLICHNDDPHDRSSAKTRLHAAAVLLRITPSRDERLEETLKAKSR